MGRQPEGSDGGTIDASDPTRRARARQYRQRRGTLKPVRASRSTIAGCATVVLVAAGCVSARDSANDDAAAAAAGITFALRLNRVASSRLSDPQKVVRVRQWLADPPSAYLYLTEGMQILATTNRRIDIVVYQYGRPVSMGGTERAWGRACVRYTINDLARTHYDSLDTDNQLKATAIDCPGGLPLQPR